MRRPEFRRGWTTVRLTSGLGNQLFQYAIGRAVAERTRTKLRIDISYFSLEPHREYALGDFKIRASLALDEYKTPEFAADPGAEVEYARRQFGAEVVREKSFDFDPSAVESAPRSSFICGYWQSENYFQGVERIVRRELVPRSTERIETGRAAIDAASCSVALHVRRGDLVYDPDCNKRFGVLGVDYYQRAAGAMLERFPGAEFFVFSDDPEWCRAELDLPGRVTVLSGEGEPFEDLALISACDHAIIANSTFSWWGAWLGESPGSVVIAPEGVFPGDKPEPAGLIPGRWIRF